MNTLRTIALFGLVAHGLAMPVCAQNVGIGQTAPVNKLDVNGGLSVGPGYSGASVAPANGAIIEGNTGIGTAAPAHRIHVVGDARIQGDFVNQEITGAVLAAVQSIPFNSATVTLNSSTASITIQDGNGVANSGVLVIGNTEVFSGGIAFSGDRGYAAYRLILERAEDAAFTVNLTTLQRSGAWVAELWTDRNNGLGASGGNTGYTNGLLGNAQCVYADLALNAGVTYFYRLRFQPLAIGTMTAGTFDVTNCTMSLVQIKR